MDCVNSVTLSFFSHSCEKKHTACKGKRNQVLWVHCKPLLTYLFWTLSAHICLPTHKSNEFSLKQLFEELTDVLLDLILALLL